MVPFLGQWTLNRILRSFEVREAVNPHFRRDDHFQHLFILKNLDNLQKKNVMLASLSVTALFFEFWDNDITVIRKFKK